MIFVDTSAFLAFENRQDSHHFKAVNFKDDCLKSGQPLITSDYVLDESLYDYPSAGQSHPIGTVRRKSPKKSAYPHRISYTRNYRKGLASV